jgi:hypothetical protein
MRQPERAGCICPACTAELEQMEQEEYRLAAYDRARDPYGTGTRYGDKRLRRDDWQRIAAGRLPAQEEQQLRETAQMEFWAGLLAGEIGDPEAEQSLPGKKAGGEQVLARLAADQYKQNKDQFDRYDTGHLWITTKRLLFQGKRGNVPIPIDKVSFCGAQPQAGGPAELVTVRRRDRAKPLLFVTEGQIAATIGGLALKLQWSARHFVELVNSLRKPA